MRRTIPFRLFVPAAALLAAACDDSSSPMEPVEAPFAEAEAPEVETIAAERTGATPEALDLPYWADGYLYALNASGTVSAQSDASYNRSGGAIVVTRVAGTTGRYIARFRNLSGVLGGKSTVHVTSAGAKYPGTYCKPLGGALVRDSVEVRCYRIGTGAAVNADFSLEVLGKRGDRAFAFANQPTAASYAPAAAGSYNPGGTIRVVRNSVGSYHVVFTNMAAYMLDGSGGHVQVNAVGTGKAHCLVDRWEKTADVIAYVSCYGTSGARADTKFTAHVTGPASHLAYVWAGDPTASSYTPNPDYAWNPMGGDVTITRNAVGAYTVRWTAVDGDIRDYGNAQVTAWGFNNAQCRVNGYGIDAVHVGCYGPNGAPIDTHFTALLGS